MHYHFVVNGSPSHTGDGGSLLYSEWTKAWMRFIYEKGYFIIYSHPLKGYTLCLNHLMPGEHYEEKKW